MAFPLVLPMGWVDSPPYFCALTETICDLANAKICTHTPTPQTHRLEALANTTPPSNPPKPATSQAIFPQALPQTPRKPPLATTDVYVDDFIALAQTQHHMTRVRRLLLQSIDEVLRPLLPSDSLFRKEPTSIKKLLQGDAHWAYRKTILGWSSTPLRKH